MTVETSGADAAETRDTLLLRGRVAIVYALGLYYLFLPFAALCMAAAVLRPGANFALVSLPFVLQIGAMVASNRLKTAYEKCAGAGDPALWARRYTIMSAVSGAIWGLGAILWFDFGSFESEAYLVLAFLGLSATEFVVRAAYRPAYLAHAIASLGPLAFMLTLQGGIYQSLSAILMIYFGGVLYMYGGSVGQLLDGSILIRHDHGEMIAQLRSEKDVAEATRDVAEENERAKSEFISNVSHELRTPLNAILGMAQLLERSDLEKAQRDHVKVLLEAGRGLKTLLDDIIALASKNEKALQAVEACDLAQAARTVTRLLQPNAWEKRLRLSTNVAPGLPRVAADPPLIRRVLLKLINNAIKFTDRGNVEIALDTTQSADGRQMVRVVVTDTGPGIPNHLLSAIFQPFTKSEDAYGPRSGSSGIGLAVAKRLIESVGGTIGVESEPGMGASFWITVPATESAPAEEPAEIGTVTPPHGLALLGFVDDAVMRKRLEEWLMPFGNRITFTDSLAQASTVSSRGTYAAIVASANMVDALAAAPGQQTPILALINNGERIPDGADHILRWPASPETFYAAVHAVTGDNGRAAAEEKKEDNIDSMIDAKAMADLEKSLGFKTLIDILQSYLGTAEELATALTKAAEQDDWPAAGRIAQDFAGAAGALGLTAVSAAARNLALGARDGADDETLGTEASDVLAKHQSVRGALRRLYPDLSA